MLTYSIYIQRKSFETSLRVKRHILLTGVSFCSLLDKGRKRRAIRAVECRAVKASDGRRRISEKNFPLRPDTRVRNNISK